MDRLFSALVEAIVDWLWDRLGFARRLRQYSRPLLIGAGALAFAGGLWLGLAEWHTGPDPTQPVSSGGGAIGGPFQLTDQDGKARTDRDFRGKLMLITFGYTFCPDVCPLSLQNMTAAMDDLGKDADRVQPIFVSVDPARDTPAQLKSYQEFFTPRLTLLTGTPEAVAQAARNYRVYYKVNGDPAKETNYLVDHSALIYLMDREGRFLTHFTHETPPEKMAAAIRRYL